MNEPTCYVFPSGLRLVHHNKASDVGHLGFFFVPDLDMRIVKKLVWLTFLSIVFLSVH